MSQHVYGAQEKSSNLLYLARFTEKAQLVIDGSRETVILDGEMLVAGNVIQHGELLIREIRRVSLVTKPLERLGSVIALAGPAGKLDIKPDTAGEVNAFEMHLYYSKLGESDCKESDATYARLEKMGGKFSWWTDLSESNEPRMQVSIVLDRLVERHIGAIESFTLDSVILAFRLLTDKAHEEPTANSLVMCGGSPPSGTTHDKRRLAVRFILLSKIWNKTTIESKVQELIEGACEVWWLKGGIRIDPDPQISEPAALPSPGYDCTDASGQSIFCVTPSREADLPSEPGLLSYSSSGYIEIYLVDKLDETRGGGIAKRCASPDAYVLLEIEHVLNNKYLLAHELGHVLSLRHPWGSEGTEGCEASTLPRGAWCAVMIPDRPNSDRVTNTDLQGIDDFNPPLGNAYQIISENSCGRNPDDHASFHHIVRDFPYDDGDVPSAPQFPFTNWWSNSDIWNWDQELYEFDPDHFYCLDGDVTQKGDPIFQANYSPNHKEPTYAGSNFMYVRVHTCQQLEQPVDVYLFLAVPGVTTEPLRPLEQSGASVVPRHLGLPAPGRPTKDHVRWDVPSQPPYPSHCCVFAVTVSEEDTPPQIGPIIASPATHNFYDLFQLLRTHNNVAQRNLHIHGSVTGTASVSMPGLLFENIFREPAAASIELDLTEAKDTEVIVLVNDEPVDTIKGGQSQPVLVNDRLSPGKREVVHLQARLPVQQSQGTDFPLTLRFLLNDQLVNGFQYIIRLTTIEEATKQIKDILYGMLRDLGVALCSSDTHNIAQDVLNIGWPKTSMQTNRGCRQYLRSLFRVQSRDMQRGFPDLAVPIGALIRDIESGVGNEAEWKIVRKYLKDLVDVLGAEPESPQEFIEEIYRLVDRVHMPVRHILRCRQSR